MQTQTHLCDDGVAIVGGHKVLDLSRLRSAEMAAADEMRRQVELGCEGARLAVGGGAIGTWNLGSGHCVCFDSHAGAEVVNLGSGSRDEVFGVFPALGLGRAPGGGWGGGGAEVENSARMQNAKAQNAKMRARSE